MASHLRVTYLWLGRVSNCNVFGAYKQSIKLILRSYPLKNTTLN